MKLDREFYKRDTLTVAKELLGKTLVHNIDGEIYKGIIVETEGYLGIEDKACHTYGGKRTKRVETMYQKPGISYVYLIYGIYNCFNITTVDENIPEAVLIRAVEPISDIDKISINRFNKKYNELTKYQMKNLTNGPGKFSMAFKIDREKDNIDLTKDRLYIEESGIIVKNIVETTRIGVDYAEEAKDYKYRFYIKGNEYISKI